MIHLSTEQLERYRQKALSAEEQLNIGDHLSVCASCRLKVREAIDLDVSASSLRADFETSTLTHLTYEGFTAYIDGSMESVDREIVESHLDHCSQCSKEMLELKGIDSDLPSLTFIKPSVRPQVTANDESARIFQGFRERARLAWRLSAIRIPVQIGGAAALIVLVVWIAGLPLRAQIKELEAQINQARKTNQQLQQEYEISVAETQDLQAQLRASTSTALNGRDHDPGIALEDGPVRVRNDNKIEVLESLPPDYQQAIRTAIETGQVKTPQTIAELARKAEVLMGPSSDGVAFALFSPVGTVTRTATPTFRWQTVEGATSYLVTIFDADYNEIARSPSITTVFWTTPEPFERGRVYLWNVTATKDGKQIKSPLPPAPEARFKVLDKNTLEEISRVRNSYPTHLLTALLYAQAGLFDEAEREMQLLVRENPKSSIAQQLLRSTRSLRRH